MMQSELGYQVKKAVTEQLVKEELESLSSQVDEPNGEVGPPDSE